MRTRFRILGSTLLVALAPLAPAAAQDAYVYYNHHPGAGGPESRLSYTSSGRERVWRQAGRPPTLTIPSGSQLCIQVEAGNAALYSYTTAATKLAADTVAGLAALIKQLGDVGDQVRARSPAAQQPFQAAATPRQQPYDPYLGPVAHLYAQYMGMQAYQLETDADSDFALAAAGMATRAAEAADTNRAALAALAAVRDTTTPEIRLIRTVHADVWNRVGVLANRFRHALETANDPFCTKVETSRLRVTLRIARTVVDSAGGVRRPVGDTVVSVVVEPTDDRTFLVEAGTILSAFTQDKRTISLAGNTIAQASDHGVGLHAAVFAMARAGAIRWLWVAVGVASADNTVSDVFVGLTFRGGASLIGGRVSAGFGLALTRVPVGVSQGTVGGPLPADVKNVDGITRREFRPGLGVTFAIHIP